MVGRAARRSRRGKALNGRRQYVPARLGGRAPGSLLQRLERANLFQDRDYPVLNDYRAVLGGLFRSLWALTSAQCAQIFPQVAPVDLKLV